MCVFVCLCVSLQASYGVEDPEYAVTQLAQTTMRSELGKLSMDKVFRVRNICTAWQHFIATRERTKKTCSLQSQEIESLNSNIVHTINQASDIRCLHYELKDIQLPPRIKESMQMQVKAQRTHRKTSVISQPN